jgi:hypothetical protein
MHFDTLNIAHTLFTLFKSFEAKRAKKLLNNGKMSFINVVQIKLGIHFRFGILNFFTVAQNHCIEQ